MKNKEREKINKNTAKEVCYMSLAVAIMAICSWLSLPVMGIPFTLQTLGLCVAAGLLGAKRGAIAVGAYVTLGAVGVPVFAGFTGGISKLLSPTGGYIVGFLFATPIIGWAAEKGTVKTSDKGVLTLALGMLIGILVCYVFGVLWFVLKARRRIFWREYGRGFCFV